MKVAEILNLSPRALSKMTTKELHSIRATLNTAANKRLRNIEKSGLKELSPAYISVKEYRNARFKSRGQERATTIADLNDVMRFMQNETSNVKGTRLNAEIASKNTGVAVEDLPRFFKIYEQFKKEKPLLLYQATYSKVWDSLRQFVEDNSSDDWKEFLKYYESNQ